MYIRERREADLKSRGNIGGLILILIGLFWLMTNLGIISWSIFDVIFRLWPVILIVIGINTIFRGRKSIRYLTWGIFCIIIIAFGFYSQYRSKNDISINSNSNLDIENRVETTSGKLKLQLASGNIKIDSTDSKLINARIPNDDKVRKDVKFSNDSSRINVDIEEKSETFNIDKRNSPSYYFELSKNLLWDINIDMGAINGTMDFSNLKVSKLDIDVGASNLDLIFGANSEHTMVGIDGAVSNIEITIPENVGVRIDSDGLIKDTNIKSLGWKRTDEYYISPNYEEVEKKIDIDVDTAIGKFDVKVKAGI